VLLGRSQLCSSGTRHLLRLPSAPLLLLLLVVVVVVVPAP